MASLYTDQAKNIRKTWGLLFTFLVVVIGLGWLFSWYYDDQVVLFVVVIIASVQALVSYWFSDKIVLRMAGAKQITAESHRELWNIVENLSITAGLPMPRVYIIQDPVPNAFATGRNPKHAAVAFTTGILALLDKNELEGVAAHELAHIGNRDMLVMTMAVILVGFITLLGDIFLRSQLFSSNDRDNKAGGVLLLIGIILMILAPIFATMLQLAISRKREFLADATGALLTRYPEGLANALRKIHNFSMTTGGEMKRANHAMAHMYISNPFGAKARRGFNKLFMTHPPVEERINALLQ